MYGSSDVAEVATLVTPAAPAAAVAADEAVLLLDVLLPEATAPKAFKVLQACRWFSAGIFVYPKKSPRQLTLHGFPSGPSITPLGPMVYPGFR